VNKKNRIDLGAFVEMDTNWRLMDQTARVNLKFLFYSPNSRAIFELYHIEFLSLLFIFKIYYITFLFNCLFDILQILMNVRRAFATRNAIIPMVLFLVHAPQDLN